MELTVDTGRKGDPTPQRRRSQARVWMDTHADTGTWVRTEVETNSLESVKRRLYTLANKAGYSLRTECFSGESEGTTVLRFLVRTRNRSSGGDAV